MDELGTGKKIGVYTQITPQGLESGNNALNAFSEEGYAPDFLLADLQGTTVSGDYTQLLNDVSAATEGRCDLITVHNMNLISADSGADGKLYADKYEVIDPRVQIGGDMALLTYQLFAESNIINIKYNCIELYQKEEDGWHVVHSTWSIYRPMEMDFSGMKEIV